MSLQTNRIFLADDHELIREGIKRLLELDDNMKVVGEANNGEEVIGAVKVLKPDCVILDINMPIKSGIEVLEEIKKIDPSIKVIMLTINDDRKSLLNALEIGADGYLLKDSDPENLPIAINKILSGESYVDKRLVKYLVDIYRKTHNTREDVFSQLTDREREVLLAVSQGLTNSEISEKLFISEKTVKNYMTSIYKKIDVNNRVKAALFAIKHNLNEYLHDNLIEK